MVTRQIKISLQQFAPSWENSWLLVKAMPFKESIDFDKELSRISSKLERLGRKQAKVKQDILLNETEELLALETEIEKEIESLSDKLYKKILSTVKNSFISGSIFDEVQRDMVADDVDMFDKEVYQYIANRIKGDLGKKG